MASHPRATGYTSAHSQHQVQTELWRSRAYAPSGEIVSVNITVGYLLFGKVKDVQEPPKLWDFTKGTSFAFNVHNLNMQDMSGHLNVDLDGITIDQGSRYFCSLCMKINGKTGQYRGLGAVGAALDEAEAEKLQNPASEATHSCNTVPPPSPAPSLQHLMDTSRHSELSLEGSSGQNSGSGKCRRSDSLVISHTLPQSKKAAIPWRSPSRDQVIGVFAYGGKPASSKTDLAASVMMHGFLAIIPNESFIDILGKKCSNCFQFHVNKLEKPVTISSDFTYEAAVGSGGFKTCHPASLHSVENRLFSSTSGLVLKELYHKKGNGQARFSGNLEFSLILTEANLHYYARALMNFVYSYIDFKLETEGQAQFDIPKLQFVEAGVFVVMPTELKHKKSEAAGPSRSFLLEERITLPDGEQFKKYIHNSSPLPNLLEEESEYHICLFLCACQHFQYIKTHHMAYVSDFQLGYRGLLTDA
ncbi:hypothetical protein GYMLUDRAFT_247380 [Collybiopsis luxurians FD-317 M1]|uniref:Alpha-type protein kinase domain-containing protein n=1 Tax=Collybiopsis luxurians FD-317 M1 TaxID=944289 RepID=A0A0D0CPB4_9AGAR|nr:hypothetical protein GYMLUDRAFT_247380 [Collybiopsis luxurians FD-317 M1]